MSNVSLIWARNGVETVGVFNKIKNIDFMLINIEMPEMDRYTANPI